jgi:hypothetical protein
MHLHAQLGGGSFNKKITFMICAHIIWFFIFWQHWNLTQGLMLGRQALCHLTHLPPFWLPHPTSLFFEIG